MEIEEIERVSEKKEQSIDKEEPQTEKKQKQV